MKRIGTGLLVLFFGVIIGTLTGDGKEKKEEMTHLVVAIPFPRVAEKDVKMVEKQVDAITRRKIGVSVEFKAYNNYDKEVNLLLTTNSQLDIAVTSDENYLDYYLEGQLCPLDSYLEKQGSGIIEQLGEKVIHCCNINNTLYGIPSYHDYAADYNSYILRKDILDQYRIDPSKIKTIEDLEEVFATVKQGEPDMTILVPGFGTILSHQYYLDGGFRVGGHMDYGRGEGLVNIFETQEYKEDLKRVRNWYLKGYLDPNPLGRTRSVLDRMDRGEIFAYTTKGKPGILSQDSSEKGREFVCVNLGKTAISHNTIAGREYVITRNTVSIEKSMELLNLMYTDSDIMNLLSYGVEGIHYKKLEDGHITYADENRYNPFLNNAWIMPNQFITEVWEGNDLTLWKELKEFNENAIQACDVGFVFDKSEVMAEYTKLKEIYENYSAVLENGLVNPEEGLSQMLEEMDNAGIDLCIDAQKKQFAMWKKRGIVVYPQKKEKKKSQNSDNFFAE